jgi:hypothetical protein
MLRSIVKPGKNLSCFGWDIGSFKIFACKNFDRVKVIEPHDSYEFDFVFLRPPKQLDAFEPGTCLAIIPGKISVLSSVS